MKSITITSILFLLFQCCGFAQESLKEIFATQFDKPFAETCDLADLYFEAKLKDYPNRTSLQFNDGEFAKYNRWKTFWKQRLDNEGYLADLSAYHRNNEPTQDRSLGPLDDLEWQNISYTQDLGVQIGLGRTNSIAFHPTDSLTFYVAAAIGGIWKTTDGGENYTAIGDKLPYLAVSCLLIDKNDPNIMYASLGDRVWYGPPSIGIYKSEDAGQNWEPTSYQFNFNINKKIYWMAADPNDPNKMIAATSTGLVKTVDGFQTFETVALGEFSDVKYMPSNSDTIYAVRSNGPSLFRSTNGGDDFSQSIFIPGSSYKRILTHEDHPSLIYISANEILYKSYDAGTSLTDFTDVSDSNIGDGIAIMAPKDTSKLYLGWFDVYFSDQGGEDIRQLTHWLGSQQLPLIHVDQRNAFTNPLQKHTVYLCNDGGVYSINTQNNSFKNLSNGLRITQYYDIGVSQTNPSIMSGGSQDNGNVFMEDGVWEMAAPTADGMMQGFSPLDENVRYNAIQNGYIYKFENEFRTEISDNIPDNANGNGSWVTPFVVDPSVPFSLIAGYQKVYRTYDRGLSWEPISNILANGRNLDLLAIAPSNSERIYAVENYGTGTGPQFGFGHQATDLFVKSIDNNNWTRKQLPVTEGVSKIVVNPNDKDHLYISCLGYTVNHKIFESKDAGDTWESISGTLPNLPCTALAYHEAEDDVLFIGTDDGIYYTFKDFINWQKAGDLPNTYISDIEIQQDAGLIRVGTHGRGIFEADINIDLTLTNELENQSKQECSASYILDSNNLVILNKEESSTFKLVDVEGRIILNSTTDTSVNISTVPGGIYFAIINSKQQGRQCVIKIYKP